MTSAEQLSTSNCPNIFFHDTDEQVLTWFRHAESMTQVEGRWQQVWQIFAAAATQECARRKLQPSR